MLTSTAAVEILFQDDIMSRIYEQPPFIGSVFDRTISEFIKLVESAHSAGKRVIRVLEVGAGTGRFTALLGQALLDAKLGETYVDYVSTDISIALAQEATEKSPWPTMTPMAFDLSVPISQQNLDPASFDIIVAFDVLHAMSSIRDTLKALQDLLLPGGHLVVIELDGNSFTTGAPGTICETYPLISHTSFIYIDVIGYLGMDFTVGSFQEWMGVLDHRVGSTHCTLTPAEWKTALELAGYSDTLLLTSSGNSVAHMAFVSQGGAPLLCNTPPLPSPALSSSATSVALESEPVTPPNEVNITDTCLSQETTAFMHLLVTKETSNNKFFAVSSKTEVVDRSPSSLSNDSEAGNNLTIVHHFTAGGEIELVKFLSSFDSTKPYIFWLYTVMEDTNMTLVGLVRSIRHEFSLWKLSLVLFQPSWKRISKRLTFTED